MKIEITENPDKVLLRGREISSFHYRITDRSFKTMSLKDFYEFQYTLQSFLAFFSITRNEENLCGGFNVFNRDAIEFDYVGFQSGVPHKLVELFLKLLDESYGLKCKTKLQFTNSFNDLIKEFVAFSIPGLITGILQYKRRRQEYIDDCGVDPSKFFCSEKLIPFIEKNLVDIC